MKRAWHLFALGTVLLAAAVAGKAMLGDANPGYVMVAAVLGGAGLVLGWITWLVWRHVEAAPPRVAICLVLGYHAFFGPVFLVYALVTDVSRNSDLPLRMYPHVVEFINSFE